MEVRTSTSKDEQPWAEVGKGIRRVVMFATLFPPCNCWPTASERARGLAQGLSGRGWSPLIITRELPPDGCKCGASPEDGAEADRTGALTIIRVPVRVRPLARFFAFARGGADDWVPQARRAAQRYLADTDVDLVWTTTAPTTNVRLGRFFQRKLSVPWVAELRDSELRRSILTVRGSGVKPWLLRTRARLFARPLRKADAVVHVSLQEAQADAPLIRRPFHVLPSAFDEMAWSKIHADVRREAAEGETLTVLFAGHAYAGRAGYSTFFEGVRRYARSPSGPVRPIRVKYVGGTAGLLRDEAERAGVSETFVDFGEATLAGAREAMRDADALLLVTAAEGYEGSPGGKLYEYLAACKPVLAVPGTDGFVADVLQRTRHGVCAVDAEAVHVALDRLAAGSLFVTSWPSADLQEFTWEARAGQLVDVFRSCLAEEGVH